MSSKNKRDYVSFCREYYQITRLPLTLMRDGEVLYSSLEEEIGYRKQVTEVIYPMKNDVEITHLSSEIEYGMLKIAGTSLRIVLGPCFGIPMNMRLVGEFQHEEAIPSQYRDKLSEILHAAPVITHGLLINHLIFLCDTLNHRKPEADKLRGGSDAFTEDTERALMNERVRDLDSGLLRNSYIAEIQMYEAIKQGDSSRVDALYREYLDSLYEGNMAASPLRHAKNHLISFASKAAVIGSIPGGCDVESIYQLTDAYIRECETMNSIDAVHHLELSLMQDLCRRSQESKIPEGLSADIFNAMNYIRTHTNEPLSVEDVAAQIHRSSSYLMKKFKSELGVHVSSYIMRCRLEEAKSLLIYSDMSLAEISNYLCFSSQSYFQNVFRKQYGITPLQYRKMGQTIT